MSRQLVATPITDSVMESKVVWTGESAVGSDSYHRQRHGEQGGMGR